jgi:hypothetical protein
MRVGIASAAFATRTLPSSWGPQLVVAEADPAGLQRRVPPSLGAVQPTHEQV